VIGHGGGVYLVVLPVSHSGGWYLNLYTNRFRDSTFILNVDTYRIEVNCKGNNIIVYYYILLLGKTNYRSTRNKKIIFVIKSIILEMISLLRGELSNIVSIGAFGKNIKYVSFDLDEDHVGLQDQYMSTILFGTVITSDESQYRVVIKLKLRDEKMREILKIDFQFHNEITMYEKIIPFLFECHRSIAGGVGDCPAVPRFFYGRNKCGEFVEKDLIVLENVNPLGFRLCEERLFIDYGHLVIALQALAK